MLEVTDREIVQELVKQLRGKSPLFAVLNWLGNTLLIGRDRQRWLVTIQEVPPEPIQER
jgi:hypothetical protein